MPSTQGYNLFYNRVYNRQVIRALQIALKNMPFLPQEGPLLRARRACSRTKKGVFFNHEDRVVELRRVKSEDLLRPLRRPPPPPPPPPRGAAGRRAAREERRLWESVWY